jgi:hypothetical protein
LNYLTIWPYDVLFPKAVVTLEVFLGINQTDFLHVDFGGFLQRPQISLFRAKAPLKFDAILVGGRSENLQNVDNVFYTHGMFVPRFVFTSK